MFGYNPTITNICTGLQVANAGINAVTSGIRAKRSGSNCWQAFGTALMTATPGITYAAVGNAVDKGTGTYLGSMAGNMMSAFTYNNPFGYGCMGMSSFGAYPAMPFMFTPITSGFYCYC